MGIRIGEISYTNILPMFYYMDRVQLMNKGCSFIPAIPSELNSRMANGTIDVGGISSFAYGEHIYDYEILPNLSVSSPGAVGSIFLFSKKPIEELNGETIALTSSSATSVNLMKIILHEFYHQSVNYAVESPDYLSMMERYSAALLIGDDAIMAKRHGNAHHYTYDLGEIWHKETGFPMTYAVFAVRKEIARREPILLKEVMEQFHASKKHCQDDGNQEMIEYIQSKFNGSTEFWSAYFKGLNHDLTDTHIRGLLYYYRLAYQMGLLDHRVESLSIWHPDSTRQSVSLGGSE